MGEYEAVHTVNKADWKTLDLPRLLAVLEPAMLAYSIAGFSFSHEYGGSTVRFYIKPDDKKYDMKALSKWGVPKFTVVVALRKEIGIRPADETIFDIGYNRCAAVYSEYTHTARCYSYEGIPALFSKAIELWKQGE